jgi:hypothetical protein
MHRADTLQQQQQHHHAYNSSLLLKRKFDVALPVVALHSALPACAITGGQRALRVVELAPAAGASRIPRRPEDAATSLARWRLAIRENALATTTADGRGAARELTLAAPALADLAAGHASGRRHRRAQQEC